MDKFYPFHFTLTQIWLLYMYVRVMLQPLHVTLEFVTNESKIVVKIKLFCNIRVRRLLKRYLELSLGSLAPRYCPGKFFSIFSLTSTQTPGVLSYFTFSVLELLPLTTHFALVNKIYIHTRIHFL